MTHLVHSRLTISVNGLTRTIGPEDPETWVQYEALIANDFVHCHPGDSLEGLKRRARFAKEDKGLLDEWMTLAAARAKAGARAPGKKN